MKKLFLLAACFAVGCQDPLTPDEIRVSVSAAPAAIKAGESMSLAFAITNGTDVDKDLAMSECPPPFEILNAAGAVVGPGPRLCSLALRAPIRVAANSTLVTSITWDGDASETTATGARVYLAPGTYYVRPRVAIGTGFVFLHGDLIPVTIIP